MEKYYSWLLEALLYLSSCQVIHNDIKGDNILLKSTDGGSVTGVLIDFGKACFVKNATKYSLSCSLRKEYLVNHPQIPPDVVNGISHPSLASDVYSFGRVLRVVNEKFLKLPVLFPLTQQCMEFNGANRPSVTDLQTFLLNLFN